MKSFYTTIIILIIVTINLYSQFEFKDKVISDLKFQGEQFILEDSQRIIDPETLDAISEYASEFVVPPVFFEDASGLLDFEHLSLPFGGDGLGGAAWFDYNNDGFLDLFLTNGKTQANALFRNNSDGTFTNVAVQAGVENTLGNSGVVAADIDNDGFKDLFLTGEGGLMGTGQSAPSSYITTMVMAPSPTSLLPRASSGRKRTRALHSQTSTTMDSLICS